MCSNDALVFNFIFRIVIFDSNYNYPDLLNKKQKTMKIRSPCVRNELSFLAAVTCIIIKIKKKKTMKKVFVFTSPCVQNELSFLTAIACIITQIYKNQWKACLCSYAQVFNFLNQCMTCHFWQQQSSRFIKTEIIKRVLVFMWCAYV